MADEEDGGRVEGNVGELRERTKIVLSIAGFCTDPTDGTRDNEAFEGVVGESGGFSKGRLVEDVFVGHG